MRSCYTKLQILQKIDPHRAYLEVPSECPESPILALFTQHARTLAAHCQKAGFIVRPVVPPTVPDGTERVRVCLHAGNSPEELDRFIDCVAQWLEVPLTSLASHDSTGSSADHEATLSAKL